MNVLNLKLRFSTPVFARGADPKKFEITPQSIKGLMRFWYRALLPNVIQIHKLEGKESSYAGMKYAEELLFGSTNRRSAFDVMVSVSGTAQPLGILSSNKEKQKMDFVPNLYKKMSGSAYAAYGMEPNTRSKGRDKQNPDPIVVRDYLPPNSTAELSFIFRKNKFSQEMMDFWLDFWGLLSIVGGIGAKSRKGYGSFRLEESWLNDQKPTSFPMADWFSKKIILDAVDQVSASLKKLLIALDKDRKLVFSPNEIAPVAPFPALTTHCYAKRVSLDAKDWHEVMEKVYGFSRNKNTQNSNSERGAYRAIKHFRMRLKNGFSGDCVCTVRKVIYGRNIKHGLINEEIGPSIFGLPLQYLRIGERGSKSGYESANITNTTGRKASPIFITIHKVSDTKYTLFVLIIPSFISNHRTKDGRPLLSVKPSTRNPEMLVVGNEDYDHLIGSWKEKLEKIR